MVKRVVSVLIAVALLLSTMIPSLLIAQASLSGSTTQEKVWNYFKGKGFTNAGAAAMMGNIQAESAFSSNNLQDSYERSLGYNDASYTTAVDNGSYSKSKFVYDAAGYGLCQWTYWSRKQGLYEFVKNRGVSISNLEAQLDYTYSELSSKGLVSYLKSVTDLYEATVKIMVVFENPADQSQSAKNLRYSYAQNFYNDPIPDPVIPDPITLTVDSSYSTFMPLTAYLCVGSKVSVYNSDCATPTGGEIWTTDCCAIQEVYTNGWCKVSYPTSSGNKTAYTQKSNFFIGSSRTQKTAPKSMDAYSRSNLSTRIGCIDLGDVCYVIGTSGSATEAIYPTSSGYKMGWTTTSEWNYVKPSTDERFDPYCPIRGYLVGSSTVYPYNSDFSTTTGGKIFTDDYCTINDVYSNGWCQVTYPAGSGTRTAYTPLSSFVYDTSATPAIYTARSQINVYPRSDLSNWQSWWVSNNDVFFVISTSGNAAQVLYPVDEQYGGGYKIGWISKSDIPQDTFSVTYNANGGSGAPAAQTKVYRVDLTLSSTVPTRSGYTFSGWATNSSATTAQYGVGAKYTEDADLSLYAVWTPEKYTIKYNVNGGTGSITDQTKTYGVDLTLSLEVPAKYYTISLNTGVSGLDYSPQIVPCSFKGWSKNASATTATYLPGGTFTENANTTLYAVWEDPAAGSLPSCEREGYTFSGWYTAASGGTKVTESTVLHADTSSYARWTTNTYEVTLNGNGATSTNHTTGVTATYGSAMPTLETAPSRTGCTFAGYYDATSGGTKYYNANKSSATNWNKTTAATLYARWTANTYAVTLDGNGATSTNHTTSVTATYGSAMPTLTTAPTRTGYTFAGYYDATSGGTQYYTSAGASARTWNKASDTTLYARWTAKTFTVTLDGNGATSTVHTTSVTATYGSAMPTLAIAPSRTGYTFAGYYDATSGGNKYYNAEKTSAKNWDKTSATTLYAHWTAKTFTITFDPNGGTINNPSKTVTYGSTYGSFPTVTRTGYSFNGWYTAKSGGTKITESSIVTITANITLYAHWTAKSFTVTFDANEGVCDTETKTVTYDSTYGEMPSPTRSGYGFNGWYTAVSGGTKIASSTKVQITASQTLYAQWTANAFTVVFNSNGGVCDTDSKTIIADSTYGELPIPTRDGYSFLGWYTAVSDGTKVTAETEVTVHENQTLYAHWAAIDFTVSFDPCGGTVNTTTKSVTFGVAYGSLPMPNKTGYTFTGWYTSEIDGVRITGSSVVSVAENHTLFAQWTPNEYAVSFDANGGSCDTAEKTVTYDDVYSTLPSATRSGYTFNGWYTADSGGTKITRNTKVTITASQTLYAQWTPKNYTVYFNANGGTCNTEAKTVAFDAAYGDLPDTMRTGYDFAGWYTGTTSGTQILSNTKVAITASQTLYAHWTALSYTVSFDANGGACETETKTVVFDSAYGELPTATRNGYVLEGWYTAANGGTEIDAESVVQTASEHTLYAHWVGGIYTVTFDANGGTASVDTKAVTYQSTYGTLATAYRPGYVFDGWYTAVNGGTKITEATQVQVTEPQVLYAHWSAGTFTVSFDANGGACDEDSKQAVYGAVYGDLPTATRTGYSFVGWYTDANAGTKVSADTTVSITDDQVLFAHWTANTYTVTFDGNGGIADTDSKTVTFADQYGELATATRAGYVFGGWYTNNNGGSCITADTIVSVASDHTLYALWTAKSYAVSFNANGGICATASKQVTYNAQYGTLPTPSKTGYTFDGWYSSANGGYQITANTAVSLTSDHELYAHWSVMTVTVQFNANGGVCATESKTVTFDSTYGVLPTPEREGFTFVGWYTSTDGGDCITESTIVGLDQTHTLYALWDEDQTSQRFPGDANLDGIVDLKDVILTRRFLTGGWGVTINTENADVNNDGILDLKDVVLLRRYLVGGWGVVLLPIIQPTSSVVRGSFVYGQSERGRDLVCYTFTPKTYNRTVLLNFAIHGFEDDYDHDGQLLVNAANSLIDYYNTSDDLHDCRLMIIPCANPDGVIDGVTNNGFGRCNANGVDLNRDFDANYTSYSSARNYTPYAFSAAESRALRDLCLEYDPDVVCDMHGWLDTTIGDAELAEVFYQELGLSHQVGFTSSNCRGYFANWVHQQGALGLLVEFTNTNIPQDKLLNAVKRLVAGDYDNGTGSYAEDPNYAAFTGGISCYTLSNDRPTTYAGFGVPFDTISYIEGSTDLCVIEKIYENGWVKVTYPISSGNKTAYCPLSAFIEPGTEVAHYTSTVSGNTKVYRRSDMSETIGSVWSTDVFTVVAKSGNALQIIYPLDDGGWKMGWIQK